MLRGVITCTGAQLLQHQQLTQALSVLLANGVTAGAVQNGLGHARGVEVTYCSLLGTDVTLPV